MKTSGSNSSSLLSALATGSFSRPFGASAVSAVSALSALSAVSAVSAVSATGSAFFLGIFLALTELAG